MDADVRRVTPEGRQGPESHVTPSPGAGRVLLSQAKLSQINRPAERVPRVAGDPRIPFADPAAPGHAGLSSEGHPMKRTSAFLLAPLAGLLWLGLATAAMAASTQVVNAELWNKNDGSQGVTLSTDHVKSGKVEFKVKNVSSDEDHELLLVKADSIDKLPMDSSGERVDEDKLQGLKELGDVHPGKTRNTTVTLKPGNYVLFCNEAGHFKAGMYAKFTAAP
jgi:uncharacterized cupredoxin-like copper-binding protein